MNARKAPSLSFAPTRTTRADLGFSLLELIMVMLVVSMASVPILGQFGQVAESIVSSEDMQTATQLAQERSEDILSLRRRLGYSAVAPGVSIDAVPAPFSRFSRRVAIVDVSASGECPAGAACKRVLVSVSRGTTKRAEITFLLMDY